MKCQLKYLFALLMFAPALASAHGLVTTQSQTVGDFIVEFEYNTIGNVLTGDYTLYDVFLLDPQTREGIDFDSSFIRMEKQNGPAMLAGNLAQAAEIKGFASLSGVLNDPGIYTAEVSFYKGDKTLAESKFDFTVEKNQDYSAAGGTDSNKPFFLSYVIFLAGIVLGLGGSWLFGVYKPPKI